MNDEYYSESDLWEAFCTIHWFITGEKIIHESNHKLSNALYLYYLELERKIFFRTVF